MNYESCNQCFPMQSQNTPPRRQQSDLTPSWIRGLLQFTEAVPQYNALNFSVDMIASGSYGGWANSTVASSNLAILQCPSESRNRSPSIRSSPRGRFTGMTNYVGNYGGPGADRADERDDHPRQ